MRTYVGDLEAVTGSEFEELAYGTEEFLLDDFQELFLGSPDETAEQREARSEVAREVLAELMREGESDEITWLDALYAAQLVSVVPLRNWIGTQRMSWVRKAA